MGILPAHVRQHRVPAALQHSGFFGSREVYRREGTGGGGEQLQHHPHLYRLCLRLQYRMLCHRIPALRGEGLQDHEILGLYGADCQRRPLRRADAWGPRLLRHIAAADEDPAGGHGGFRPVPGHLYLGAALPVLLQYRHRHLLGPGGLQDALPLPGPVLHGQYPDRHPLREGLLHGNRRRGLGHIPLPGGKLHPVVGSGAEEAAGHPDGNEGFGLLLEPAGKDSRSGHPQHPAAVLHLGGEHADPGPDKQLRGQRGRRIFRGGEAEQPGDYLLYHHRQRDIQFRGPEPGGRKVRADPGGLPGRLAAGVVPVRALLYCLCGVRQVSAAAFHGQELADGIADGQGVFVDPVPVLLCGVREAGGGRNPAGHQRHGAVHGRHVHGFDSAGGLVIPPVRLDRLRPGHMVLLACGLDHRYGDVPFLLPEGLP